MPPDARPGAMQEPKADGEGIWLIDESIRLTAEWMRLTGE